MTIIDNMRRCVASFDGGNKITAIKEFRDIFGYEGCDLLTAKKLIADGDPGTNYYIGPRSGVTRPIGAPLVEQPDNAVIATLASRLKEVEAAQISSIKRISDLSLRVVYIEDKVEDIPDTDTIESRLDDLESASDNGSKIEDISDRLDRVESAFSSIRSACDL
jgi:hypothetical protein